MKEILIAYIAKPWDNDNLRTMVAEAIDLRDLRFANQRLNAHVAQQNAELERLNQELQLKYQQKVEQAGSAEEEVARCLPVVAAGVQQHGAFAGAYC